MAIASLNNNNADQNQKKLDVIEPNDVIKTNTVVNDLPETTTPWVDTVSASRSIDRHVATSGYPWAGTYYQRLRMDGDFSDSLDELLDNSYQQYSKINEYILMLESPMTQSVDAKSKVTTATFTSVISDTIIPNRGDVWVADLGDGRIGIFAATTTERLSIFTTATYKCDFVLQKIVTEHDRKLLDNLNEKVVTTYYFNRNYLELGQSPILTTEELKHYEHRKELAKSLAISYIRDNYQRTMMTTCMCIGGNVIFDTALVSFINKTFPEQCERLREYQPTEYHIRTVFDLLIKRNGNDFKDTVTNKLVYMDALTGMDIIYCYGLNHTPVTHIATDKVDEIYYGWGASTTPDVSSLIDLVAGAVPTPTPLINETVDTLIARPLPLLPDVANNETYIFSKEWYTENKATCLLELMLDDWFANRPLDVRKVSQITDGIKYMNKVESFYLIPIIVFLLSYSN